MNRIQDPEQCQQLITEQAVDKAPRGPLFEPELELSWIEQRPTNWTYDKLIDSKSMELWPPIVFGGFLIALSISSLIAALGLIDVLRGRVLLAQVFSSFMIIILGLIVILIVPCLIWWAVQHKSMHGHLPTGDGTVAQPVATVFRIEDIKGAPVITILRDGVVTMQRDWSDARRFSQADFWATFINRDTCPIPERWHSIMMVPVEGRGEPWMVCSTIEAETVLHERISSLNLMFGDQARERILRDRKVARNAPHIHQEAKLPTRHEVPTSSETGLIIFGGRRFVGVNITSRQEPLPVHGFKKEPNATTPRFNTMKDDKYGSISGSVIFPALSRATGTLEHVIQSSGVTLSVDEGSGLLTESGMIDVYASSAKGMFQARKVWSLLQRIDILASGECQLPDEYLGDAERRDDALVMVLVFCDGTLLPLSYSSPIEGEYLGSPAHLDAMRKEIFAAVGRVAERSVVAKRKRTHDGSSPTDKVVPSRFD